ncbi:MAG TPA: GNAT family N-acetyltransferase [Acidimicrobiales bacterium]|nr:GNAT family N-acetyltransferase [Acidimicrobiales bacterium]
MSTAAESGTNGAAIALRLAAAADAPSIAALHADSWRRHYRGVYSDSYLDGPVFADRNAEWQRRMQLEPGRWFTYLALAAGRLVGFSHVWPGDGPWGALLDNLHVSHDHQRAGLGTRLMAATAAKALEQDPIRVCTSGSSRRTSLPRPSIAPSAAPSRIDSPSVHRWGGRSTWWARRGPSGSSGRTQPGW